MKIYTIHCLYYKEKSSAKQIWPTNGVTWAWFSDFEKAENSLFNSIDFFFEGGYCDNTVIEQINEGSNAYKDYKAWWYKSKEVGKYNGNEIEKIEEPIWAKGIVNFSIG